MILAFRHPQLTRRVLVGLAIVAVVGTWLAARAKQSSAQVTSVEGSAFGVSAPNITLFGGAQTPFGPTPTAMLPSGGSSTPVTGTDASETVVFGPATLFESGTVSVSTVGSPAGGSVTSSSTINAISNSNGENFTASSAASTCTANGTNTSSVTVTSGVVDTKIVLGVVKKTMAVPTHPTAGFSISGTNQISSGDTESFTWVFNTVTTNADGSITVIAAHEELFGPTAKGDLYLGSSTCGVTGSTTTTTAATTTTVPVTTTTTVPVTTTTVPVTTTTVPVTTTTVPVTTTTVPVTTTTVPVTTTTVPVTTTTVPVTTTTVPRTTTTTVPLRGRGAICGLFKELLQLLPQLQPLIALLQAFFGCRAG